MTDTKIKPVAWAVYWGLPPTHKNSVHFEKATAEEAAAPIKSSTDIRPLYDEAALEAARQEGGVVLREAVENAQVLVRTAAELRSKLKLATEALELLGLRDWNNQHWAVKTANDALSKIKGEV